MKKTITVTMQVTSYADARLLLDAAVDSFGQAGEGIECYDIEVDLDALMDSNDDDDIEEAELHRKAIAEDNGREYKAGE
jgi:hypothetical protein